MAGSKAGWTIAGTALAALAAGFAAGWFTGRRLVEPPPPPPVYVNPLADARKGETLTIARNDGLRTQYRVLEESPDSVLLGIETHPRDQPVTLSQIRVSRTYLGAFQVLEGDVDPQLAEASVRDFRLFEMTPVLLRVESLGRTVRCWRLSGSHRVQGQMTFWVSDEFPVHGLVRMEARRAVFEIEGFGGGR